MYRRSFPLIVSVVALALALGGVALWISPPDVTVAAQGPATPYVPAFRSITVVGQGMASIVPDIAQLDLGVQTAGATVRAAIDESNSTMDAIMTALADAGVAKDDIRTSQYSIFLDQGMVQAGETQEPVYRVMNSVSVTVRDLASVGSILDAGINAGANQISGVNFTVEDWTQAQNAARAEAMTDAHDRAEALASKAGLTVGTVISVTESMGYQPFPQIASAVAQTAAAGAIVPGTLQFTMSIQVMYELLPGTGTPAVSGTAAATGTAEIEEEVTGTVEAEAEMTGTPEATEEAVGTLEAEEEGTGTPEAEEEATGTLETAVAVTGTATIETTGTPAAGATAVATVPATSVATTAATTAATAGATRVATVAPAGTPLAGAAMAARNITVVGQGTAHATPEIATTDLGVMTSADSVRPAVDENDATMQAVIAALTDAGVATSDIRTSGYSIYLDQGIMAPGQTPNPTYRVSNTVSVTIRDLAQTGAILDAAINAGANQMYGMNFTRENWGATADEARTKAVADAQARAQDLAALAGLQLGEIVTMSEAGLGGGAPILYGGGAAGFGGGGGIAPGQLDYSTSVQITYSVK